MKYISLSSLLLIALYSFSHYASPGTPDVQESTLSAHEIFRSEVKTANCSELAGIFERYQSSMTKLDYDFLHYPIERCSEEYSHDQSLPKLRERMYRARQERGFDSVYDRLRQESAKRIAHDEHEALRHNNEKIANAQAESLQKIARNEQDHQYQIARLEAEKRQEIELLKQSNERAQCAENDYNERKRTLACHQNMIDTTPCAHLEILSERHWEEFSALGLNSYLMATIDRCCQQEPYNEELHQFRSRFIHKCENSLQAQKYERGKAEGLTSGRVQGGVTGTLLGCAIGFLASLGFK